MEWQPIDTAPKYDGPIDTWSSYGEEYKGFAGKGFRIADAAWCKPSFSKAGTEPCWCYESMGDWNEIHPQPSHWFMIEPPTQMLGD